MKQVLEIFRKIIQNERLSHLYLLVGQPGPALTELTLEISYEIINHYVPNEHLKQQIQSLNYPNLMIISKDGMMIKKSQVIALQAEFDKTSLLAGPRVFIINDIETMGPAAANSLLKFLEEPKGEMTVGLLVTRSLDLVLPTIKSRAQILFATDNSHNLITELSDLGFNEPQSYIIPLVTTELAEASQYQTNPNFNLVLDLFELVSNNWNNSKQPLIFLLKDKWEVLFTDKELFDLFLNLLLRFFLDILLVKLGLEPYLAYQKERLTVLSQQLVIKGIEKNIELIQTALKRSHYYINLELCLESLCYELERKW